MRAFCHSKALYSQITEEWENGNEDYNDWSLEYGPWNDLQGQVSHILLKYRAHILLEAKQLGSEYILDH